MPHRLSFIRKQPRQSHLKEGKKSPPTSPIEAIRIREIYIYIYDHDFIVTHV